MSKPAASVYSRAHRIHQTVKRLYFRDDLVWIGGFAAIEMNVSNWRAELLGKLKAT